MKKKKGSSQCSPKYHPYPSTQLYNHEAYNKLVEETLREENPFQLMELSNDDKIHADACDDIFPDSLLDEKEEEEEEFAGIDPVEQERMYQEMLKNEDSVRFLSAKSAAVGSDKKVEQAPNAKPFEMKILARELYELSPKSVKWLDADFYGYGPPAPTLVMARHHDDRPSLDKIERARYQQSQSLSLYVKVRKTPAVEQVANQDLQEPSSSGFKVPNGVPPRRPGGVKGRKLPPNESRC